MRHRYRIVVAALSLLLASRAEAQRIVPDRVGAQEAVEERHSTIGLIVDSAFTTEAGFVREFLFAPADDQFIALVGPMAWGQVILGRTSLYGALPYLVAIAQVPSESGLPGLYDFDFNNGFGDLRAGVAVDLLSERQAAASRLTVSAAFDVIAPTGTSRFENDKIPLGNGFWNVSASAGVSRFIADRFVLFASGAYVERRQRTFDATVLPSGDTTVQPGPIKVARSGVGFVIRESIINLQVERFWVGEVRDSTDGLVEPAAIITRIGGQASLNRVNGLAGSLFAGIERIDDDLRLLATFSIPLFRVVGVDF